VTAGDLDDLDGVAVEIVVFAQFLERGADIGQAGIRIQGLQLLDRQRTGSGEQGGFNQLGEWRHGQ
jgi:hypothetical protein